MAENEIGDQRFHQGVDYFNGKDFFNAHEVWEELWLCTFDESREFLQGLIQWSLALYHFSRGNMRGARGLFVSGAALLAPYGEVFKGVNLAHLKRQMETCLAEVLSNPLEKLAGKDGGAGLLRFVPDPTNMPEIEVIAP
ncbi:MAG: DUF309 domain-containing protein [Deltaproteobacteria bacterium]|nr:DUF309 domain-containing protein [Deltaproteobacteria bacterium]